MATVTYIRYESGRNSTPSALRAVINYCLQPHKTELTENVFCTSGQHCTPRLTYQEFMATKAAFGKENGIYFHHYVQSFSPEEQVTPEEVNAVGREFAARAFPGFEVLIATHIDRAHRHNHFIVNSVNPETGKKFHSGPDTLKRFRAISDEICMEHGLSVLPPYEKGRSDSIKTGEYRTAVRRDSWKFRLMASVDRAMDASWTKADFIANMRTQGYDILWSDTRKYITYTCRREKKNKDGTYKKCRDRSMHGEKYLRENLEEEFHARAKLYAEIFGGATDTNECGTNTESTGKCENRHGTMESDRTRAEYDLQTESGTFGTSRRTESEGDRTGNNSRQVGRSGDEGAEESDRTRDRSHDAGSHKTGWESSRESLRSHGQALFPGRFSVVAPSDSHRTSGHFGSAVMDLCWLGAGITSGTDPDETDEEKKRREAQNAGSALGLAVGLAIGIATQSGQSSDENDTAEDEDHDEDLSFGMTM